MWPRFSDDDQIKSLFHFAQLDIFGPFIFEGEYDEFIKIAQNSHQNIPFPN